MAADADAPATTDPLATLERVVRGLGDELAFFRRRALEAERRLRDVLARQSAAAAVAGGADSPGRGSSEADRARIAALEAENAELRARMAEVAERTRAVASRMRFARQQDDAAAAEGAG